jgi:hypothetical protein
MKELLCPLLKKPCIEHGCKFFVHVAGQHPQTGAAMDLWDCTLVWMPVLLTSSIKEHRHTTASVDSMRNEVVQRQDALNNVVALSQRQTAKQIGEQEWTTERLPKAT